MRFLKILLCILLCAVMFSAALLGCFAAQRGTEKISGPIGKAELLTLHTENGRITLVFLNETFTVRS